MKNMIVVVVVIVSVYNWIVCGGNLLLIFVFS